MHVTTAKKEDQQPEALSVITRRFGVGKCRAVKTIEQGKVNFTSQVETSEGTFVLQRLKPPYNEDTVLDGYAVTEHLIRRGFPVPRFRCTPEGVPFLVISGAVYRLMSFIPGRTLPAIDTPAKAFAAGEIVGRFHRILSDIDYRPRFRIEGFHDVDHAFALLKTAAVADPGKAEAMKDLLPRLEGEIPRRRLTGDLPARIIHGDLKYTNILFDDFERAVALLDFDTFMQSTLPVEMGDAFRSWCTVKDSPTGPYFDEGLFEAGWRGYMVSRPPLSPEERRWIVPGIMLLLMELACRYLLDYFTDSYFAWDPKRFPSRPAHNLYRARRQIAVLDDILAREKELGRITDLSE